MEKRLQSIKFPRDLTLGGTTKQKKIYTPNLNVSRNKTQKDQFLLNGEKKKKIQRQPRNNKTVAKSERFVQSTGIFSDGVGNNILRKTRPGERTSYTTKEDTAMPVPKVRKNDWQIVDNKNELKIYDNLMGEDENTGDHEEKLPFSPLPWGESHIKQSSVPSSLKLDVKIEPDECARLKLNRLKIESNGSIPREFKSANNFTDSNPALMLWSMPDSFAGKGLSDDPNVKTLFDYKLKNMLEGEIGKIRIRKSGKIEVLIGCVKYNLEDSKLKTFSEKIVAIDMSDPKSTPKSAVLGSVQSRFMLNPDWQFILKDL
ncbi:DNA-directed RNA polymerase III subunit RPC4-like [Sitophilus oryzae]|uniref:DNA-directed RNA polymerase III subunit RPC4-like n=1 Tax=Sitophilus oryzae TaxID=7048 RepID=A0A6J2X5R2_SITOR|nr:DNA-directed RNA polymerase III subunit RPC4-like [Sitophilus oryzae]